MNIIYAYNQLQEYEKSKIYLAKALPYVEMEENKKLQFSFLMAQYELYWYLGLRNEIMQKMDEIVKYACDAASAINYVQDVQMACQLLSNMKAYDQWERVLQSFEIYCQKSERIHVNVVLAEMWIEFYKQTNQREKYVEACIKYTEVSFKRRKVTENELANAIDIKLELREKENACKKEHEKSQMDSLTSLGNRYKLEEDSKKIQILSMKKKIPMLVGILDVDCFKQYNDTYGHIRGDECLKAISQVLAEVTKECGSAYRFGGDEFVIIGNGLEFLEVKKLAQNIKDKIADLHIENINSNVFSEVTISQGFCVFVPEGQRSLDEIISSADIALYQVKKEGKNNYFVIEN